MEIQTVWSTVSTEHWKNWYTKLPKQNAQLGTIQAKSPPPFSYAKDLKMKDRNEVYKSFQVTILDCSFFMM